DGIRDFHVTGVQTCALPISAFGYGLDRVVVRPIVGQPVFAIVMVTIGIGFLLRAAVSMVPGWGVDTYFIETPFYQQNVTLAGLEIGRAACRERDSCSVVGAA